MTPCDGTPTSKTWCCGRQNTTCCGGGDDKAIILAPTRVISTAPASTITATVTVTAQQTVQTDIDHTTQLNAQQSSSDVSTGAVAGMVVGTLIGGMLIGGLASWFIATKRQQWTRGLYVKSSIVPLGSSSQQHIFPTKMPLPSMREGVTHGLEVVAPPAEMDNCRRF